jgi:son of sevenless-like protein
MPYPPMRSQSQRNPVSSTSAQEAEAGRIRTGSLSSRSLRRRPVLLDDNPTLSRLTTLLESSNTREIDKLASPDMVGSFEALSKRTREERVRQRKASEDLSPVIHIRAQNGTARYLQLQYADQIDENDKGYIRTATLVALIERLTWDVDPSDLTSEWKHNGNSEIILTKCTELKESHAFTNVFLLTFRTFMTADQLFDCLVERFRMKPPKSLTEQEYKDWKAHLRAPVQRRTLEIFSQWLEDYRLLEEEPQIAQRLTEFLGTVVKAPLMCTANAMIKTIERLVCN